MNPCANRNNHGQLCGHAEEKHGADGICRAFLCFCRGYVGEGSTGETSISIPTEAFEHAQRIMDRSAPTRPRE